VRSEHFAQLIEQIRAICPQDPQLNRRISGLICLTELVAAIQGAGGHREALEGILLTIQGQFPSRRGAILVVEPKWRVAVRKGFRKGARLAPPPLEGQPNLNRGLLATTAVEDALGPWAQQNGFEWLLPLWNGRQLVGLVCLGGSPMAGVDSETALLLVTLADFAGMILGDLLSRRSLEILTRKQQTQMFQLRTLYELAGSFACCYEEQEVFEVLARNLMGVFFISRMVILLPEEGQFKLAFAKGTRVDCGELHQLESLVEPRRTPLSPQAVCPALAAFKERYRLQGAFPLAGERSHRGWVLLGPRLNGQELTAEDQELLLAILAQAATALDAVDMHREMVEKKRMEGELQIAREIQQRLLPRDLPRLPGYDLAVEMRPYQQVGGDFYDIIELEGQRTALVMADVSGKSLPASMIMTTAQSCLRAYASLPGLGAVEVVERLNRQLLHGIQQNRYVTLFFAILDPARHELTYVNAGHNRPILVHADGTSRLLDKGGIVTGLFPDPLYQSETLPLEAGSRLLIFTDGLSEVVDQGGEEFGEERLRQLMAHWQPLRTAAEMKQELLEQVLSFGDGRMVDDLTLMLLRRT